MKWGRRWRRREKEERERGGVSECEVVEYYW